MVLLNINMHPIYHSCGEVSCERTKVVFIQASLSLRSSAWLLSGFDTPVTVGGVQPTTTNPISSSKIADRPLNIGGSAHRCSAPGLLHASSSLSWRRRFFWAHQRAVRDVLPCGDPSHNLAIVILRIVPTTQMEGPMQCRLLSPGLATCIACTFASIIAAPTEVRAQSYAERMHAARNELTACCFRPRTNFRNPQLESFVDSWRAVNGPGRVMPDLSERDLATLNGLLAQEWSLRGVSSPSPSHPRGDRPAPYNPSLMPTQPFVPNGPANNYGR